MENANRARSGKNITPENLEPHPKNPLIAGFFRNIGYSEKLGAGVRKMFKYGSIYSGVEPEFVKNNVFRVIQPLDDTYSYDLDARKNSMGGQIGGPWEVLVSS